MRTCVHGHTRAFACLPGCEHDVLQYDGYNEGRGTGRKALRGVPAATWPPPAPLLTLLPTDSHSCCHTIHPIHTTPHTHAGGPQQYQPPQRRRSHSSPPTASRRPPRQPLSLEQQLQRIAGAQAPPPKQASDLLYQLGKCVDQQAKQRKPYEPGQAAAVVRAGVKLVAALLPGEQGAGSSSSSSSSSSSIKAAAPPPPNPVQQLGSVEIGLTAWALAQLVGLDSKARSSSMRQLVDSMAEHAVGSSVMDQPADEACRHYSRLMYGAAAAGIRCMDSRPVAQLFAAATAERLPRLLNAGQQCNAQDVSNIFLACHYAGFTGSLQQLVSAVGSRMGVVMEDAKPQNWANMLWGCAKLQAGGVELGQGMPAILGAGVAAMAEQASKAEPQHISNTLWALARFGWQDAGAVGVLAAALAEQAGRAEPQHISNALWALS